MFNRVHKAAHGAADKALPEAASSRSRILARRLARSLTTEEIDCVSGARAGGATYAGGTSVTPDIND